MKDPLYKEAFKKRCDELRHCLNLHIDKDIETQHEDEKT